jgi:predicted transcriptional regulator
LGIEGFKVVRRGWEGLILDILEAAAKPEKKMRIMYRSNMNFERFDKYFHDLLNKGLIERHNGSDGKATYVVSERGKTLMDCLSKAHHIFASDDA